MNTPYFEATPFFFGQNRFRRALDDPDQQPMAVFKDAISAAHTQFDARFREGEDIRLHPMGFDAALALVDSREIQVGPLILMLHWLARHRDRLRAMA